MFNNTYQNNFSEKEKNGEEYLTSVIDLAIAELVIEKNHLRKAYNYYNGKRDAEQFKYLEENFGIGNPTSIDFIPLVRRHVDALVGEHLQNKIKPKISCKDKKTLTKISQQRASAVNNAEVDKLKNQLMMNIEYAAQSMEMKDAKQAPGDEASDDEIQKLKENIDANFISEFEIAAQNVLHHLTQSKSVDLYQKMKMLFLDILIAGQCFYKVSLIRKGETPLIEVLNPFDVFFDKNPNSPYIKTAPRVVVRRWMFRDQILNRYGEYLSSNDISELNDVQPEYLNNEYFYVRGDSGCLSQDSKYGYYDAIPYGDGRNYSYNLIPVYEVEWLTTNKVEKDGETIYRMDRYSGVRIGQEIYVNMGKDEDVIRSVENPYECSNTINGMFYSDRNGEPYSLVLSTANLQDTYDLLHFHRDSLIANSGVRGDFLDIAQLPTFLGQNTAERIAKWKAYKKQGTAIVNTAQEGRASNLNTIYSGYDDTVSGQAIQAIQLTIQATEDTCSAITGVYRERLGGIEQRDAVTNVEVGVKQSAIITKQYYQVMDNITTELLIDAINMCKESYRDGMVGSIILGNRQKVFTITPKNFSFTDYDVHIADSGDIIRDMQKIEQLTLELIKSQQADLDIIFEAIGTESMTEMKEQVLSAFGKRKQENNVMQQMQQQLEQLQQQLQQTQQEAQKIAQENEKLKGKASELEQRKIDYEYDVRKEANRNTRNFNDQKTELDRSRVELEKLQLFDDSDDNNEIKNN